MKCVWFSGCNTDFWLIIIVYLVLRVASQWGNPKAPRGATSAEPLVIGLG